VTIFRKCTQHRSRSARRGLTLIEMILAVGLGLILVGGMYTAMQSSSRQVSEGKVTTERLRITRALYRRMELDLRAAMFDADTAVSDTSSSTDSTETEDDSSDTSGSTGGTSGGQSAGTGTDTTTTTVGSSGEDEQWTGSLGIRGSASELWIDLSYIRRELSFPQEGSADTNSDLKTVAYFLTSASNPATVDPNAPIIRTDPDGIGLARSMGDRSVLRTLNSSSSDSILPGPTEVLAPEINGLKFRYFDGLTWYEEWDSTVSGSLPRAVEIAISYENAVDDGGDIGTSVVSSASKQARFVVAIPVSDPLVEEE
jgi:type II secretory pathway pseudopilin PulG